MFTNLDFLSIGKPWIPNNNEFKERQSNFVDGRKLYEGKFQEVFSDVWEKITSRYMNEQVMIAANLFRPLTDTFKMLAFKDDPKMTVGNKRLDDYYTKGHILDILGKAFISQHAQGQTVFKIYLNSDNKYDISVVNPEMWIPVYDENNLNDVVCHVVANTYEVNNTTNFLGITDESTEKFLNAEIHYKGRYIKRLYRLDDFDIIQRLENEEEIATGLDDFCVIPCTHNATAWREWGKSAYADIMPIVEEIVVRLSNNSKILDKHSDPAVAVTDEMLSFDTETGHWYFDKSDVFKIGRDGQMPQYITWDGNLQNSVEQLNRMMDLYFMLSGSNPQLFGQDVAGNLSGEALAKIFIVPIAKTKEIIQALEVAANKAFGLALSLQGETNPVNIQFIVGDFNSLEDIVNRVTTLKSAGIISNKKAVTEVNPDATENEILEELELIDNDTMNSTALDLESLYPKDEA